jgi:hypothetical protein
MKKSRLLGGVCSFVFFIIASSADAAFVNVALQGQATASSSIGPLPVDPTYPATPEKAIDGDLSLAWNSGDIPTGWIEIDLGQSYPIDLIRGFTAQTPDSDTTHNVYLDGSLAFIWSGFTTDEQWLEQTFLTPISAQFVKIETVESLSWVAWNEIEVIVNNVPIPPALWLFGSGLLGLIGVARKKAA